MTTLNQLLPTQLIEALGWTILHSIWQGAVLAILLTLTWIVLRKNSSQVRYFVATTALFTLFLVAAITFVSLYWNFSGNELALPPAPSPSEIILPTPTPFQMTAPTPENLSFWANFQQYFEGHLPLIVSMWLLGVVVLMLRFLGGIAYLQRLKHYQNSPVAAQWQGTLRYLSAQIGVKQKVQLLESALVKVPMVIGYLKPVILMPLGTLAGLPMAQIESILAHELAHIRRHDYLVNILQSLVDITLFFNPFAWWISECVREERENCCDDIALQATGDVLTFAKTLANLEALRLDSPQLSMTFTGKRGSLKQRIQRIIYGKSQRATFSEGFFSGLVLVFCLAVVSYQAKAEFFNFKDTLVDKVSELLNEKDAVDGETPELKSYTLDEFFDESELAQPASLADTIRFGEDFMLITSPNGKDFQIFKGDKLLKKEEYTQFSNLFTVEDTTIKISNAALNDKGLEIKLENKEDLKDLAFYERDSFSFQKLDVDSLLAQLPNAKLKYFHDNSRWFEYGNNLYVPFEWDRNGNFYFDWKGKSIDTEKLREWSAKMREESARIRKESDKMRENAEKFRKEAEIMRRKAEIERLRVFDHYLKSLDNHFRYSYMPYTPSPSVYRFEKDSKKRAEKLIQELVKDGYLNNTKQGFRIKIKEEEIFINGKKVKEQEKYNTLIKGKYASNPIDESYEIIIDGDNNYLDKVIDGIISIDNINIKTSNSWSIEINFADEKADTKENKEIKEELLKDGLMKKSNSIIKAEGKDDKMSINGNQLNEKMKTKYEELFDRLLNFHIKLNRD